MSVEEKKPSIAKEEGKAKTKKTKVAPRMFFNEKELESITLSYHGKNVASLRVTDSNSESFNIPYGLEVVTNVKGEKELGLIKFSKTKHIYDATTYTRGNFQLEGDPAMQKQLMELFKKDRNLDSVLGITYDGFSASSADIYRNVDFTALKSSFKDDSEKLSSKNKEIIERDWNSETAVKAETFSLASSFLFTASITDILKAYSLAIASHILREASMNYPKIADFDTIFNNEKKIKNLKEDIAFKIIDENVSNLFSRNTAMRFSDSEFIDGIFKHDKENKNFIQKYTDVIVEVAKNAHLSMDAALKPLYNEDLYSLASTNGFIQTFYHHLEDINLGFCVCNPAQDIRDTQKEINKYMQIEGRKSNSFLILDNVSKEDDFLNLDNIKNIKLNDENEIFSVANESNLGKAGINRVYDLHHCSSPHLPDILINAKGIGNTFYLLDENQGLLVSSRYEHGVKSIKADSRYFGLEKEKQEDLYLVFFSEESTYYAYDAFFVPENLNVKDKTGIRKLDSVIEFPKWDESLKDFQNHLKGKEQLVNNINKKDTNHASYKYTDFFRNPKRYSFDDVRKNAITILEEKGNKDFLKKNYKSFIGKELFYFLSTLNISKNARKIPNNFYYEENTLTSIEEILKNLPLATHISRMPIGETIYNVASGFNVKLPEPTRTYSLTERALNLSNLSQKDKVTSKSIGAMGFSYLPKSFTLKEQKDKDKLIEIFTEIITESKSSSSVKVSDVLTKEILSELQNAEYLFLKNQQTMDEASRFVSKEILVLADSYAKDMGKLNISSSAFYEKLKEKKIFDINDYIEVENMSSKGFKKISASMCSYIREFKKDHLEKNNITQSNIDAVLIKNVIPLLFKDELTNEDNTNISTIGKYFDIDKFYDNFLTRNTASDLVSKVLSSSIYAPKQKEQLVFFLNQNFVDKEFKAVNENSKKFFEILSSLVPDDEQFKALEDNIFNVVTDKKLIENAISKTVKTYAVELLLSSKLESVILQEKAYMENRTPEALHEIKVTYAEIKKINDTMYLKVMGLRPFQYTEAIGFAALKTKNLKNTLMLFAEMRVGKTRTALTALLMQSFLMDTAKSRSQFFVQNKNIDDITEQAFDMFPLMARDMTTYGSAEKSFIFKKDKSIEMPLEDVKFVAPHLVSTLKDVINYRHTKNTLKSDSEILVDNYSRDIEMLNSFAADFSVTQIEEKYDDSAFVEILRMNKKYGKADDKLKQTLKTVFLYVHRIHEQGYLGKEDVPKVVAKLDNFIAKYYRSKLNLNNLSRSRFGVDLLPKNIFYSFDVNSTVSDVKFEKSIKKSKVGDKASLSTPYMIDSQLENSFEIYPNEAKSQEMISKTMMLIKNFYDMPDALNELSEKLVLNINATSLKEETKSEFVKTLCEEEIEKFFTGRKLNEDIINALMISHVTPAIKKEIDSLHVSPYYEISSAPDTPTTWQIDLKEIFSKEVLLKKIKEIGFNSSDEGHDLTIDTMSNNDEIVSIVEEVNKENYYNALFNYFYSPLNPTIKQKIRNISPLLYAKASAFTSDFTIDSKTKSDKVLFPLTFKEYREDGSKKIKYIVNSYSLSSQKIDPDAIHKNKKHKIDFINVNFSHGGGSSILNIPEQENISAFLNGKRIRNLASTVTYGLSEKSFLNTATDEIHKGLKKTSSLGSAKQFDAISAIHKNANANNGSFASLSGTPISGTASDIGPIMTTGATAEVGDNISKNIQRYCTSYAFKDEIDALMVGFLNERYTTSNLYAYFSSLMKDKTFVPFENTLVLISEELQEFARKTIKTVDSDELEHIVKNINSYSVGGRLMFFREIFGGMEDTKGKTKIKDVDVLKNIYSRIKEFTRQVPGISNFATLSEIIRKMGSNNAISISRPTDEVKYNILDKEKILTMIHERDASYDVELDYDKNIQHKILMLDVALRKYIHHTHVVKIKSSLSKIFSTFSLQLFDTNNLRNTLSNIDFEPKNVNSRAATQYINSLIGGSSKTTNDSISELFSRMLNSEQMQGKVSEDKLELLNGIMPLFNRYLENYNIIYQDAKESMMEFVLNEDQKEPNPIKYDSYILSNIKDIVSVPPHISDNIIIGSDENFGLRVSFNHKNEPSLVDKEKNELPLVFKTHIKVNRWEFLNGYLDVPFNLVNTDDKEMLELIAAEQNIDLFEKHINLDENIRVMSARSSILQSSFLDTISAAINRDEKEKTFVIIVNQSSGASGNIQNLINQIDSDTLDRNNIDIKISSSSASFTAILNDVNKNKNVQIACVGNYIALAEGIDMSMIDTGFYLGSLRIADSFIQSSARQRGPGKEESSFYLAQDGAIKRFKHKTQGLSFGSQAFKDLANLTKVGFTIDKDVTPSIIKEYDNSTAKSIVPSVMFANYEAIESLKAYEAIMSGIIPKENMRYESKGIYEPSVEYKKELAREALLEKEALEKASKATTSKTSEVEEEEAIEPTA